MQPLTLIEKALILKKTRMFSQLDLDALLAIADRLSLIKLDIDETIFDIQEQAYSMYFIVKGTVEIQCSNSDVSASLKDDHFFGEESLFSSRPREYRAFAKEETTVLTLPYTDLLAIIHEYPKVAIGFLEVYAKVVSIRTKLQE